MKEFVSLLAIVLVLLTLVNLPDLDRPDWAYYRAEVRAYQAHAELETMGPRAMVFARVYLDSWLMKQNQTTCTATPPKIPSIEVQAAIRDDLRRKGFSGGLYIDYSLGRGESGMPSDQSFSGFCREGSILVKAMGYAEVIDPFFGIKGERDIDTQGCQPTAYFYMKEKLDNLSKKLEQLIYQATAENLSRRELLELIKLNLTLESSLPSGLTASWRVQLMRKEVWVTYTIQDLIAEVYHNGLKKGFLCTRTYEFELPETFSEGG